MKFKSILRILIYTFLSFLFLNSFSQQKPPANTKPALQIFDRSKVDDGYILLMLTRTCLLIDREGNTLFNSPGNLISFFNNKQEIITNSSNYLVVYNKNNDINWKYKTPVHHDITVSPNDNIFVLSTEDDTLKNIIVRFDIVLSFDAKGKQLFKWSVFEHRRYMMDFIMKDSSIFRYKIKGSSDPDSVLFNIAPSLWKCSSLYGFRDDSTLQKMKPFINNQPANRSGDSSHVENPQTMHELFHMNSIQIIPANSSESKNPAFRNGNILLSFCNYSDSIRSFIAIFDPVNYKIVWYYVQEDGRPIHNPTMLSNGNILVYVNWSNTVQYSSIDEINPITKKIEWTYTEDFPKGVKRYKLGSSQRLPNGNTLISNGNGYLYEVSYNKKIVWQLYMGESKNFISRALFYSKEQLNWLFNE